MKKKFRLRIKKELIETYSVECIDADNLINNSFIMELMEEDIKFVTHYSPDYWAEEIYKNQ